MNNLRPTPDSLLKSLDEQREERRDERRDERKTPGKLKIFLGASAGVGKTYAMLEEARVKQKNGVKVVLGYVETHGRKETIALLEGLESIPHRIVEYRDTSLKEFDLDEALAMSPELIIVDELAHSNAPESRHKKRYQDIEELLDAGIDVYTALNIQHLESLNDTVLQITGVRIRETIPDSFLEKSDSIEFIDLPPNELLERLKEGKIYHQTQVAAALSGFFKKGNLTALRELALRRMADKVDDEVEQFRSQEQDSKVWATKQRILVWVPALFRGGTTLIRSALRLGTISKAEIIVVAVEPKRRKNRDISNFPYLTETFSFAEEQHIESVLLSGENPVSTILEFARSRNCKTILVGESPRHGLEKILKTSQVEKLIQLSGEVDVLVVTTEKILKAASQSRISSSLNSSIKSLATYIGIAFSLITVAISTGICWILFPVLDPTNLIMFYFLGVIVIATQLGRFESIFTTILSIVAFDFLFVPPYYTLAVSNSQYVITFGIMLIVGIIMTSLTQRIQDELSHSNQREERTRALFQFTRELSKLYNKDDIIRMGVREIANVFTVETTVFTMLAGDELVPLLPTPSLFENNPSERAVATWAYDHREKAGYNTQTLPGAAALYLPLISPQGAVGVLAVKMTQSSLMHPRQFHLLETFSNSLALAIERTNLATESVHAKVEIEKERVRNTILSSVSHDMRTPLTVISGTALLISSDPKNPSNIQEYGETIVKECARLDSTIRNLLDITRLESGIKPHLEWESLEELVLAALSHTRDRLEPRTIHVRIEDSFPLLYLDAILIEKVFINILENIISYTSPSSSIEIDAKTIGKRVQVIIKDSLKEVNNDEERIIAKGFELGIPICKAIVELHHGIFLFEKNNSNGVAITISLPVE